MGGVTDLLAGEVATEFATKLIQKLWSITRKSCFCKPIAEQLITTIEGLLPTIQEIKYSGVELPPLRQSQLDRLSEALRAGLDLAHKVLASGRWNVYRNLQYARKLEKLDKTVSRFLAGPMQAHVLADVHHIRADTSHRLDRIEGSARRLEHRLNDVKIGIGAGGWLEEAVRRSEEEGRRREDSLVNLGPGMALGKKAVKEMLLLLSTDAADSGAVVGICGIGGSGKTTLAREVSRDEDVRCYFKERIIFLTVSQSPNVDQLKAEIWGCIAGNNFRGPGDFIPPWTLDVNLKNPSKSLIILDDVWSLSVLEQLICRVPGCRTLVVSRSKYPTVFQKTYELDLLKAEEAMSLFCYFAFGQNSLPLGVNETLVKQVVDECKGLPLALKVIGASLRGQPEMFWTSAKKRLMRGKPICESHETKVLERMAISIACLPEKVRECYLDLGSFPEDKRIPLDVLINVWVELHDLDEEEAFAILVELSDKNLLSLVKADARTGDIYSSYLEISVCQHDVLRDLVLHLSSHGKINERKRLLMPMREDGLPKEWERNMDEPFNAQIVSIHTGEMKVTDWFHMDFPKAEVLILNFSSSEYFLPPFIGRMPKLRALIIMNYGSVATLHNFSVFSNLSNLRSLWLEKLYIPPLHRDGSFSIPKLRKLSLFLCKISESLHQATIDLPKLFPSLSELTMDYCEDLLELPRSICRMHSLKSLSITNCKLRKLPEDLGKLASLQILRIYGCLSLKMLPPGICELIWLKYFDISQCVNLGCLPERIGGLGRLEKIDMRECSLIQDLPQSTASLWSLRRVICDEGISWMWKDLEKTIPDLYIQVAEESYGIDWLSD